jgi:hypothetical protein
MRIKSNQNDMKQTAVEWLLEQFEQVHTQRKWKEIIEQAKAMEVKQRQADTNHGYAQGYDDAAQGKEPMQPETL